jgi:hypothetical protein
VFKNTTGRTIGKSARPRGQGAVLAAPGWEGANRKGRSTRGSNFW